MSHDIRDDVTRGTIGLNRHIGPFAVGANIGADTDKEIFAGITVTLSLGRDPWSGAITAAPDSKAQDGRVAARVFVDENLNGRFDEADEPLPDVEFMANRRKAGAVTRADGTVVLADLPLYREVPLSVRAESIDDPHIISTRPGVIVPSRPGAVPRVEFPLQRTGEVDGTIRLQRLGGIVGLGDVVVELLDEAGEVVASTRSEFDGFYLFELVRLGTYSVRISPDQLRRLSMQAGEESALLTSDRPVVSGIDFTLSAAR